MLASPAHVGNPIIRDAVALLPGIPYEGSVIALLILGFGLKMGLVPLHVWMPLAHPVAPFPASAVLSGIIVKAGLIGLIRFLPFQSAVSEWGTTLLVIGLFTALYGVAIGLTQQKLKTILAYSTVSQMGVIAAILGCGLAQGNESVSGLAAFYALHHMLVKGSLFLGLGIYTGLSPENRNVLFWPMAILALSLAGLPLTSGAAAKFATKDVFATASVAWLATLATVGSGLLMMHFLLLLRRATPAKASPAIPVPVQAALAVMALSTLFIPAAILPLMSTYKLSDVMSWNGLIAASWPLALAALLAVMLRHAPQPRIPEGDVIVLFQKSVSSFRSIARAIEWSDERLKSWPMACLVLLGIAIALGLAALWPL
jgi:formate hydrogenlyase subunit 3/multisubunit Na+/H+ antiporter MnhD subunit